jgi:hypothetical protein
MTRFLIGIDDTDNLESRGTGHRARQLAVTLSGARIEPLGITRHQLLVDPRIPYTSHNSSACIQVQGAAEDAERMIGICRDFLLRESADGSDAGLCVARRDQTTTEVTAFGLRAKRDVVRVEEAHSLAAASSIHLEGLTGTRIGVIGALAGIGLHAGGDDGRFLWLPHLREMSGVFSAGDLRTQLGLDRIETEGGEVPESSHRVDVGDWARPLPKKGSVVLYVERADRSDCEWQVIPKMRIKELSN